MTRNRRAVLDGLGRMLDAAGLEELFTGPDDDALFVYDLLTEAARARSSSYYWEICRTARRRGVTPEYVVDRAAVLLAAIDERRRTDLYRVIGVPPLSSAEVIRQRYLDVAKQSHPDTGGDGIRFRQVKESYEILRDAERRAEYERFWLRAIGPIDRVLPAEDRMLPESVRVRVQPAVVPSVVVVEERVPEPEPVAAPEASAMPEPPVSRDSDVVHAAARLFAARSALDRRFDSAVGTTGGGLSAAIGRLESAIGLVTREELERWRAELSRATEDLEALRTELAAIGDLKRQLGV
jgi:curved DNA-binding protein CbpA